MEWDSTRFVAATPPCRHERLRCMGLGTFIVRGKLDANRPRFGS